VESALASGDISSAQTALKTLQSAPAPGSSSQSGGSFDSTLSSLESAIASGDLTSAAKYLTALESESPQGTKDSSSTSQTTSTSSTSNSNNDPIGTFLKNVESAISTGSLSAAQSALTAFQAQPALGLFSGASTTGSTLSLVA
jgi:ribosomal protein S20